MVRADLVTKRRLARWMSIPIFIASMIACWILLQYPVGPHHAGMLEYLLCDLDQARCHSTPPPYVLQLNVILAIASFVTGTAAAGIWVRWCSRSDRNSPGAAGMRDVDQGD